MPRNLLVLLIAAGLALWATIAFASKAWELFASGKLFFAVMSAGIAAFAVYLMQGYVRLMFGLVIQRAAANADTSRRPAVAGDDDATPPGSAAAPGPPRGSGPPPSNTARPD
jgi:hypothetical protein